MRRTVELLDISQALLIFRTRVEKLFISKIAGYQNTLDEASPV